MSFFWKLAYACIWMGRYIKTERCIYIKKLHPGNNYEGCYSTTSTCTLFSMCVYLVSFYILCKLNKLTCSFVWPVYGCTIPASVLLWTEVCEMCILYRSIYASTSGRTGNDQTLWPRFQATGVWTDTKAIKKALECYNITLWCFIHFPFFHLSFSSEPLYICPSTYSCLHIHIYSSSWNTVFQMPWNSLARNFAIFAITPYCAICYANGTVVCVSILSSTG